MPLGGRWTDRTGGRPPVTLGLVFVVTSSVAFGTLRVDTPLVLVIALMVVNNVGIVLCTMPLVVMGLSAVASRLVPQASALRSLTRQVSGALGTAVLATIITAQVGELTFTDGNGRRARRCPGGVQPWLPRLRRHRRRRPRAHPLPARSRGAVAAQAADGMTGIQYSLCSWTTS